MKKYYHAASECRQAFAAKEGLLDEMAPIRQACLSCVGQGNVFTADESGPVIKLDCQQRPASQSPAVTRGGLVPVAVGVGVLAAAWWLLKR